MRLMIKQRVFAWTDSYDIYDENHNVKYQVKGEFFSLGHKLHVYDQYQNEVGIVKQRLLTLLPTFEIEVNGKIMGNIQKRFTFFKPKYDVDFNGWHVEGDFLEWEYDVYDGCSSTIHIHKEFLSWGDTYMIDYANPEDEIMGLMLVLAIDAANCSEENSH